MRRRSVVGCCFLLVLLALLAVSGCSFGKQPPPTSLKASSGPVTVTTDLPSYATGQAIGVTVTNTSKRTYYTLDNRSGCSIVQLQQYTSSKKQWVSVDGCQGYGAAQSLEITAGLSEPFTLAPTAADNTNAWDTGTYRVVLAYSTNPDGTSNETLAYSAGFTIHG
ncbi:MAG: hypothetical protein ABI068_14190 [Ktedonobacterales bacterium]